MVTGLAPFVQGGVAPVTNHAPFAVAMTTPPPARALRTGSGAACAVTSHPEAAGPARRCRRRGAAPCDPRDPPGTPPPTPRPPGPGPGRGPSPRTRRHDAVHAAVQPPREAAAAEVVPGHGRQGQEEDGEGAHAGGAGQETQNVQLPRVEGPQGGLQEVRQPVLLLRHRGPGQRADHAGAHPPLRRAARQVLRQRVRAGHHLQLRESLFHPGRVRHGRRDPGHLQEERPQGHRAGRPAAGGRRIPPERPGGDGAGVAPPPQNFLGGRGGQQDHPPLPKFWGPPWDQSQPGEDNGGGRGETPPMAPPNCKYIYNGGALIFLGGPKIFGVRCLNFWGMVPKFLGGGP